MWEYKNGTHFWHGNIECYSKILIWYNREWVDLVVDLDIFHPEVSKTFAIDLYIISNWFFFYFVMFFYSKPSHYCENLLVHFLQHHATSIKMRTKEANVNTVTCTWSSSNSQQCCEGASPQHPRWHSKIWGNSNTFSHISATIFVYWILSVNVTNVPTSYMSTSILHLT